MCITYCSYYHVLNNSACAWDPATATTQHTHLLSLSPFTKPVLLIVEEGVALSGGQCVGVKLCYVVRLNEVVESPSWPWPLPADSQSPMPRQKGRNFRDIDFAQNLNSQPYTSKRGVLRIMIVLL